MKLLKGSSDDKISKLVIGEKGLRIILIAFGSLFVSVCIFFPAIVLAGSENQTVLYFLVPPIYGVAALIFFILYRRDKRKNTAIYSQTFFKRIQCAQVESDNKKQMSSQITYTLTNVDDMDGHSFEKFCALVMERNGFKDVIVTPGSGDQGVDIVAKKDGIQYAVQCKCYSSKLGNTPVQEVCAGKFMYGCQIGVVMTNSYFTENARALAEKTGVLLWDRNVLAGMMQK
ncbi:restriction endonuclease [Pseudoflavonifractor sp. AF19-9AC]|uniref:restriction endonuclease n=1 Tax=Pseudoflavonifractor sp. AF19-9AC TaxID=2292244 RepID=UPI000E4B5D8A|nr:restriction endonuclease [Pseudoflavonifractor sp. AF19-9AC]RHR08837.1 restriction endonuclease [Pseudoflavonifractor sp. AF19-9AC]